MTPRARDEGGSPEPSGVALPRVAAFDVLRGVAILLVLGRHAAIDPARAGAWTPLALAWSRLGWTGVDLFFVLSGYLVGGVVLREIARDGSVRISRFFVRRALRIWPPYLAYLAGVMLLVRADLGGPLTRWNYRPSFAEIVPNLLHLQNYLRTPMVHTWSLAVEEHFYVLLPFALYGLTRVRLRSRLVAMSLSMASVACASIAVRAWLAASRPFDPWVHLFPTHARLDSLALGVYVAAILERPRVAAFVARWRALVGGLGLAAVAPFAFLNLEGHPWITVVGFSQLAAGYGALVAVASTVRARLPFPLRVLGLVGGSSYSMYLWHIDMPRDPLIWLFSAGRWCAGASAGTRWVLAMTLYVVSTAVVGHVGATLVERPALALRARWERRRSRPVQEANAPAVAAVPSTSR